MTTYIRLCMIKFMSNRETITFETFMTWLEDERNVIKDALTEPDADERYYMRMNAKIEEIDDVLEQAKKVRA